MQDINFVIGIELGSHTRLNAIALNEMKPRIPVSIRVHGESNFITAIAYHPKRGILIGNQAITTEGVTKSYLGFINWFNSFREYQKALLDYVNYIVQAIIEASFGITVENSLFIFSYPSGGFKNNLLDASYIDILRNCVKTQNIMVIPESFGILKCAIELGDINKINKNDIVLVIQLNSLGMHANFIEITAQMKLNLLFSFSNEFGISIFNKLIFRNILEKSKYKEDILTFLKTSSVFWRRCCEQACFTALQRWSRNPCSTQAIFVELIPDKLDFRGRFNSELILESLNTPLISLRDIESIFNVSFSYSPESSWEEELKMRLIQIKGESKKMDKLPDMVLFSGSAFQIPFVESACKSIFPESRVLGGEQEYAVAGGLAYWGQQYVLLHNHQTSNHW